SAQDGEVIVLIGRGRHTFYSPTPLTSFICITVDTIRAYCGRHSISCCDKSSFVSDNLSSHFENNACSCARYRQDSLGLPVLIWRLLAKPYNPSGPFCMLSRNAMWDSDRGLIG
ncbi:hypothetical protein J6590_107476, partial [Homalodisca vitripennis]